MFRKKEQRLEPPKEAWAIFDGHAFLARDLPRYLLTRRRRSSFIRVVTFVLFVVAIMLDFMLPIWLPWTQLLIVLMCIFLLDGVLLYRFEHRLARQLREHDRLLCTHCGYPLRGSEPHGRCPECGTEYDHDSLRVAWTNLRWAFWKPRG